MSDLLSASSLLLAVIGLLYSAWYPEISSSLQVKGRTDYKQDNLDVISKVENAYRFRAVPLSIASTLLTMILTPDMVKIVIQSAQSYINSGFSIVRNYSAVNSLFTVMVLISVGFTIHLIGLTLRVRKQYVRLNK